MVNTFHRFLYFQFQGIPSWLEGIDFATRYANGSRPDDVVFVDVGGGDGQEAEKLLKSTPNLSGKVILQDLETQLKRAPDVQGVEKMVYDYFTEQPVKGK